MDAFEHERKKIALPRQREVQAQLSQQYGLEVPNIQC
jgi:hypothetical protein